MSEGYRELLQLDPEMWAKLSKEIRGFPVYYRWTTDGKIEIWPLPPPEENFKFGVCP